MWDLGLLGVISRMEVNLLRSGWTGFWLIAIGKTSSRTDKLRFCPHVPQNTHRFMLAFNKGEIKGGKITIDSGMRWHGIAKMSRGCYDKCGGQRKESIRGGAKCWVGWREARSLYSTGRK